MTSSMLKGLIIGAVAAVAVGGIAGYKMFTKPAFADVISVHEVTETVKVPRQECKEETVQRQAPSEDKNRIAGSVLGAVIGGVVGSQVGKGSGKTLATIGGAAAGGYAGNRIEKHMQESDTLAVKETRCKTVYDTHKKRVGYDVAYRLGDKEETVRMDHDPGPRIPVKDGHIVLTEPAPQN